MNGKLVAGMLLCASGSMSFAQASTAQKTFYCMAYAESGEHLLAKGKKLGVYEVRAADLAEAEALAMAAAEKEHGAKDQQDPVCETSLEAFGNPG